MSLLRLVSWGTLACLRSPLVWWLLGGASLLPLLPSQLGEIGLWAQDSQIAGLSNELAFLVGLAGTAYGLNLLSNYRRWSPLPAGARNLAAEGALLLVPTALLVTAPRCVLSLATPGLLGLGTAATVLHLAALGLCIAQLPLGPRLRWPVLFFAAWLLPALSPANALLDDWIRPIFDAGSTLRRANAPLSHSSARLIDFGPIIALLLLAAVLAPRSRERS